jgi:hypothetical protein
MLCVQIIWHGNQSFSRPTEIGWATAVLLICDGDHAMLPLPFATAVAEGMACPEYMQAYC